MSHNAVRLLLTVVFCFGHAALLSSSPQNNNTSVHVNYSIPAGATPGPYDVNVSNNWGTSNAAAITVASGATVQSQNKAAPQPSTTISPLVTNAGCGGEVVNPTRIVWYGKIVGPYPADDIECATTNVMAGQQINIYVPPFLITGNNWGVPANLTWTISDCSDSTCASKTNTVHAVGGYTASAQSGTLTPISSVKMNTNPITFYFTVSGHYEEVDVTVTFYDGTNYSTYSAWARFYVKGPTDVTVTPSGQEFFIGDNPPAMNWGIQFKANATPPNGYTGTLTWIQLVQSFQYTWIYSDGDQPTTSAYTPGFDAGSPPSYPFATGAYAADGPLIGLESPPNNDEIEQTASGQYQMYLMWNPGIGSGTSASIPVPLGSLTWNIAGDVVWQAGTGTWVESTGDSNATTNKKFTTSSAYPTWQSPAAPRQ